MQAKFQQVRETLVEEYHANLKRLSQKAIGKMGLTNKQVDDMTNAYRQGVSDVLRAIERSIT